MRHYLAIYNALVGVRGTIAPFLAGLAIPVVGVRWIFAASLVLILTSAWLIRGLAPQRAASSAQ